MTSGSNRMASATRIEAASDSGVCSRKKVPVTPSTIVSSAPPAAKAMTGRPLAWASSGVKP